MERRIAVVLMASGYSERFGSNKLLEPFGNRCLFTYAVDLACASDVAMKIIVTRYEPITLSSAPISLLFEKVRPPHSC